LRADAVPALPPYYGRFSPAEARSRFDEFLCWTVQVEYPALASFLPEAEREAFADYYAGLPDPGDMPAIARMLRGVWRGDAGWAARWLASRPQPRVLDAGSGFGTFAMLFAAMGAEVTAVDLRPDRLDAADHRLSFFRANTGLELPVRNVRADLTQKWEGTYDLVWVFNALSHIDPLPPFLTQVRDHLRPGGVIVIGDINGDNPSHQRRLARERRESEVHQVYIAPDGTQHAYAVERTFTPAQMREVLEQSGLRVTHHEMYWGGLGVLPETVYRGLVQPLQRFWWLGGGMARRQMVVAEKA
jgi:2-polyprenyl-3-methyl-5-hydroxy-6-metoxy-1,4-benzoquinol methylase